MATKKKAQVRVSLEPAPEQEQVKPKARRVRYLVNGVYVDAWGKPIEEEEERVDVKSE